jgi:hypothetical protein
MSSLLDFTIYTRELKSLEREGKFRYKHIKIQDMKCSDIRQMCRIRRNAVLSWGTRISQQEMNICKLHCFLNIMNSF